MARKSNTGSVVQGMLKGMGGAFLGAIAAKIAGDIYEQIKQRYLSAPRDDRKPD